jgi:hypothetical protein
MAQTLAQKIAAQKAAIAQAQSAIEDIQNPPKYSPPAGSNPVLDYLRAERAAAASEAERAAVLAQAERALASAQAALPPMEQELTERSARLAEGVAALKQVAAEIEAARLAYLRGIDRLSGMRGALRADQMALNGAAPAGGFLDRMTWAALNKSIVVVVLDDGGIFAEVRNPGISLEGRLSEHVKKI